MFKNMKISIKMLLMVAIPIAGMLVFVARDISDKTASLRDLNMTSVLTGLAVKSGSLIHELQKERGLSAGFVASKGEKFRDDLARQRGETDLRIKAFKEYIATNTASLDGAKERLGAADALLGNLAATRAGVDGMKLLPPESIVVSNFLTCLLAFQFKFQCITNQRLASPHDTG